MITTIARSFAALWVAALAGYAFLPGAGTDGQALAQPLASPDARRCVLTDTAAAQVGKAILPADTARKDTLFRLAVTLPEFVADTAAGDTVRTSAAGDTSLVPVDAAAALARVLASEETAGDTVPQTFLVSQGERDSLQARDRMIRTALSSFSGSARTAPAPLDVRGRGLTDTLRAADVYQARVYDTMPAPTQPPYVKIGKPVRFTLDNGLKVLVYSDPTSPVVTFYMGINNRRVFEKDKKGVSDLTAAMLLAGVQNRTKTQITDSLANMGSRYRINRSSFYVSGLSKYATQNFNLFADVVLRPSFPLQEFFTERKAMKDVYASLEARPEVVLNRVYRALAFAGKVPAGEYVSQQSIDRITVDDCQRYYSTYWRPNNAVLLIMGDITEQTARALVQARFRAWAPAEVPQDKISAVNDLPSTAIDFVHDPSATDCRIVISNIAEFDYNSPDVFPAMFINYLMGGDLLANIRATLSAVPYAEETFSLSPDPLGGYMYLSSVSSHLDAVRVITEKTARLQAIRRDSLDAGRLAAVKQYLIGRIALSFEDRNALGSYGVAVENGTVSRDFLEDILKQIHSVTAEDVMRVAQKYIKPSQFRIVVYGDARKVVPPLELAGYDVSFYDKNARAVPRPSLSQPISDGMTAERVLQSYFEAMGGERKMRAVKMLRQQYDILIGERRLQAVVLSRLPYYSQQQILYNDQVYMKRTFNGNMGYTKVENTTTALSEATVEKERLVRSIFPLLDYQKPGFEVRLDSIVPVLGHFTYRMRVTLPSGSLQNFYFSVDDSRVLRIENVTAWAKKETDDAGRVVKYVPEKIASYSDYKDYKEVDGVMYPFTIEIRDAGGRIIWKAVSIDPKVSLPEKLFR